MGEGIAAICCGIVVLKFGSAGSSKDIKLLHQTAKRHHSAAAETATKAAAEARV
jgi:hypothetical protein